MHVTQSSGRPSTEVIGGQVQGESNWTEVRSGKAMEFHLHPNEMLFTYCVHIYGHSSHPLFGFPECPYPQVHGQLETSTVFFSNLDQTTWVNMGSTLSRSGY